ncbi:MAG: hypothetical protein VX794_07630 [Nitrospinota bacterium]|nr:hypothetical protein [Nitrospinota bacterium]
MFLNQLKRYLKDILEVGVLIAGIAIVLQVIFGKDFSFVGFDVVGNLEQVLKVIGKNNLVGLFTLAILSWIVVRRR